MLEGILERSDGISSMTTHTCHAVALPGREISSRICGLCANKKKSSTNCKECYSKYGLSFLCELSFVMNGNSLFHISSLFAMRTNYAHSDIYFNSYAFVCWLAIISVS